MKKKNGFTLIEMVITLVLMIALGLLITNNVVGMLEKNKDKDYQDFVDKIESAACTYAMTSKYTGGNVKVSDLIREGLVDENLENPSTGQKINLDAVIEVKMTAGERTCKVQSGV